MTEEEGRPTGPSYVCFDATALIHCAATGYLNELGSWFPSGAFTAKHIMDVEIRRAAAKHPTNLAVCRATWLTAVPVEDHEDLAHFAWLLEHHWKSPPGKDRGEAEVLVLCRRYGWTAIMDDDIGRGYAEKPVKPCSPKDPMVTRPIPRIPSAMLLTTILAATAWGITKHAKAWKMHCAVDRSRGGFSLISYDKSQRSIFDECVDRFRALRQREPDVGFPDVLAKPGLDGLVALICKQHRRTGG